MIDRLLLFTGRCTRKTYAVLLTLTNVVAFASTKYLPQAGEMVGAPALPPALAPYLPHAIGLLASWVTASLIWTRINDMSAANYRMFRYLKGFYLLAVVGAVALQVLGFDTLDTPTDVTWFDLTPFGVGLLPLIARPTRGPNRFGEDPRRLALIAAEVDDPPPPEIDIDRYVREHQARQSAVAQPPPQTPAAGHPTGFGRRGAGPPANSNH